MGPDAHAERAADAAPAKPPLRVLLVEDEPDHAELVAAYLAEAEDLRVDLVLAPSVGRAVAVLDEVWEARCPFHVVLCDQRLPDSEYWETVERVATAARDTPVVALTSIGDEDIALDAVRQGAQDYLVKSDLSPDLLRRTLRYAVERARHAGELRALNASLEGRVREQTDRVRALAARLAAAEQEERRRLALVLHDDLQQRLHALSITLALLARAPSNEERGPLAERAARTLAEATALTRTLATDLNPPALRETGLGAALRWLAARKRETMGLEVEVDGDADVPDPALRALLYHLVREALFNVAKHAGIGRARVVVEGAEDAVAVRVEDEGAGFDVASLGASGGGFGLASLQERLEAVGGRLGISSAPGAGTRVSFAVPMGGSDSTGAST